MNVVRVFTLTVALALSAGAHAYGSANLYRFDPTASPVFSRGERHAPRPVHRPVEYRHRLGQGAVHRHGPTPHRPSSYDAGSRARRHD